MSQGAGEESHVAGPGCGGGLQPILLSHPRTPSSARIRVSVGGFDSSPLLIVRTENNVNNNVEVSGSEVGLWGPTA